MGRAEKILERLKKIEEEYSSISELAKASKYLIFVDRHYMGSTTNLKSGLNNKIGFK